MSALLACDWPGNIRQLVNALTFAEATCDHSEITVNDLPEECLGEQAAPMAHGAPRALRQDNSPLLTALENHQWNVTEVARAFEVSRPTIYRWMQQQGIVQPRFLGRR